MNEEIWMEKEVKKSDDDYVRILSWLHILNVFWWILWVIVVAIFWWMFWEKMWEKSILVAKDIINFNLSYLIYLVVSWCLIVILIWFVWLLVFSILYFISFFIWVIKQFNWERYKYILQIDFIK